MSLIRVLVLGLVVSTLSTGAAIAAESDDPKTFFGTFKGPVMTEVDPAKSGKATRRDSEVEIKEDEDRGFRVRWTTIFVDLPESDDRRMRTTEMHFVPSGRPHVWRATNTGDPLHEQMLIWARVAQNVMTVYIVGIDHSGRLITASYRRTVDGDEMKLEFERTEDGESKRKVVGTLARVKE